MDRSTLGKDNPRQITEYLLKKHGHVEAYKAALDGALEAQEEGNNYRLSIWREVKRMLAEIEE
jgi:hypothetical protein